MAMRNSPVRSDGTVFGDSATDLVAFYGATPIVKPTAAAQSAVATSAITAAPVSTPLVSGYSFSTTAEMVALITALNSTITRVAAQTVLLNRLRLDLVNLGLIVGS